jgi:Tfp pilus assembly protein PilF
VSSPEFDELLTQAAVAAAAGRIEESLEGYRRALELAPENAQLHHNVGVLLARHGDLSEGISLKRNACMLHAQPGRRA